MLIPLEVRVGCMDDFGRDLELYLNSVNKWISTLIASATVKMMKQKDESLTEGAYILTLPVMSRIEIACILRHKIKSDKEDRRTVDIYPHFEDAWVGASAIISIKRLSRFLSCSQPKSKLETTAGSSSPYFSNDKSEIFHEDRLLYSMIHVVLGQAAMKRLGFGAETCNSRHSKGFLRYSDWRGQLCED
ncbi:unnamed protein product [Prunus armeniaca]|uniref:Uncharacterized protein n=1 Tax=Prunus armeniaca TaxID=36596 RepID=A0A6J5U9Q1_PRUAR|nr:unnamed protein product [Prunus armeniaca]